MTESQARRSPAHPVIDPELLTNMRHARAMLTQQELAVKAGVSRSTVSLLETGGRNASVLTLRKLCKALECRPEDLIKPVQPAEGNSNHGRSAEVQDRNRPAGQAAQGSA